MPTQNLVPVAMVSGGGMTNLIGLAPRLQNGANVGPKFTESESNHSIQFAPTAKLPKLTTTTTTICLMHSGDLRWCATIQTSPPFWLLVALGAGIIWPRSSCRAADVGNKRSQLADERGFDF